MVKIKIEVDKKHSYHGDMKEPGDELTVTESYFKSAGHRWAHKIANQMIPCPVKGCNRNFDSVKGLKIHLSKAHPDFDYEDKEMR